MFNSMVGPVAKVMPRSMASALSSVPLSHNRAIAPSMLADHGTDSFPLACMLSFSIEAWIVFNAPESLLNVYISMN